MIRVVSGTALLIGSFPMIENGQLMLGLVVALGGLGLINWAINEFDGDDV
jgi:hypothetical protein